jgi:acyl carrier protein
LPDGLDTDVIWPIAGLERSPLAIDTRGESMESVVREILRSRGDLSVPVEQLDRHSNLFDAGLSSFGTVEVMLALEEHLGTPLPERLLTRETFSTIAALAAAAETLRTVPA